MTEEDSLGKGKSKRRERKGTKFSFVWKAVKVSKSCLREREGMII